MLRWASSSETDLRQSATELSGSLHRGMRQVVLDFTDVSHLDYRGVKPLLARAEAFRRAGGDVKLSGLSPYLARHLPRARAPTTPSSSTRTLNDARAAFEPGHDAWLH